MRPIVNTLSAFLATIVAIAVLYIGIETVGGALGTKGLSAAWAKAPATQTYICQHTKCSSTSCHAAIGQPMASSNGQMTCPYSHCSSPRCHGQEGKPPPYDWDRERRMRHFRRYYVQSGPAAN